MRANRPAQSGTKAALLASLVVLLVPVQRVAAEPAATATARAEAPPPPWALSSEAVQVDRSQGRPRIFVLTDMGNEPDDQMSMVRLLLYANDLDIEGLIATTSTWQKDKVQPETIRLLVQAYGEVRPNLLKHARGWPEARTLDAAVAVGPQHYGLAAMDPAKPSAGALKLIAATDRTDPRPLQVTVWGGANTLAEALAHVRATRPPEALAAFVAKLRVISISDQDDAGPWIRKEFPKLSYLVKPSPPDGSEYASATWTGISGDEFYRNGDGADFTTVTNEWLDKNIRQGPFGAHYPRYTAIMEGDTPSFLNLLPNGLDSYRNASWGGWGGRYVYRQPYGESRRIWTQGGDSFPRVTSADTVVGQDGRPRVSDQATIWRWREAFQNDFAARMSWTYKPYADANHPPVVRVLGHGGEGPIEVNLKMGSSLVLDAGASIDPDGNKLTYRWFPYAEAGFSAADLADVRLDGDGASQVTVTPTSTCRAMWLPGIHCGTSGEAHVILAVTDSGSPALTRYRRVIIHVDQ
jgi:hypothetical protein